MQTPHIRDGSVNSFLRASGRLLAVGGLAWMSATTGADAESVTDRFCRPDGRIVAVFVDVTSGFDGRSRELFQDGLTRIYDRVEPGDRLLIRTIEDAFTRSQMLFEECIPFCESQGILDWFKSDCTAGLVVLRTREQRQHLIAALRDGLNRAGELPNSEIVRTLASELRPVSATGRPVELFIFSDLIENSDFLPGKVFWSEPAGVLVATLKNEGLIPDLTNASVNVFGVGRRGTGSRDALSQDQMAHLADFWNAYFAESRARNVAIAESLFFE